MRSLNQLELRLSSQRNMSRIKAPTGDVDQVRQAAVLILIGEGDDPDILVTERSATLREHAGQVSFPGGAVEPVDGSTVAAALRETTEEIGLPASQVRILGQLPPAWLEVTRFWVTPVVGAWDGNFPVWPVQAEEVAAVHRIPVSTLVDPEVRVSCRHPGGTTTGPAFQADGVFIWGMTAHLLSSVLGLAGWEQPWDRTRLVEVPKRFGRPDSRYLES